MKDLKIVNGVVPDFENDRFVEADLLVHKGVIEQVGTVRCEACEVIDARGNIVAPGFINIHAHEDTPRYFPFTSERELFAHAAVGGTVCPRPRGLSLYRLIPATRHRCGFIEPALRWSDISWL